MVWSIECPANELYRGYVDKQTQGYPGPGALVAPYLPTLPSQTCSTQFYSLTLLSPGAPCHFSAGSCLGHFDLTIGILLDKNVY